MIKVSLQAHKSNDRVSRAGSVENIAFGILGIEALGPQAFKINRVRQNQIRVLGDAAGRQEVTDVAFRYVADPIVDAIPHLGRIRTEIGHLQLIAEKVEHAFAQLPGIRDPKFVGDSVLVIRGPVL